MDWLRDLQNNFSLRVKLLGYSKILVIIMSLLFVVTVLFEAAVGTGWAYTLLGAEIVSLVAAGQVWRFLTYAFLHGNIFHLLFNMYALWVLGQFVERYFGRDRFFSTFVLGAVFAGIVSFLSSAATILSSSSSNFTDVATVGASGAIFALLGLIFGNIARTRRYGVQLPIDQGGLLTIIVANLLLGFMVPGIDNAAHIGGLIAGLLLSLVFEQQLSFSNEKWKKQLSRSLFLISVLILIFSILAHGIWLIFTLL